jgi:purine-cytosine permease-like protein
MQRKMAHESRVAFIPPAVVFISLYAVGTPWFTTGPSPIPDSNSQTHSGDVLSFLAIIFGSSSGWVPVTADYVSIAEAYLSIC